MTEHTGDLRDPALAAETLWGEAEPVVIIVCDTCRPGNEPYAALRPGARRASVTRSREIAVRQAACLGNGRRALSAAPVGKGSWSHGFGQIPYRGRPQTLKDALAARISSLELIKEIP